MPSGVRSRTVSVSLKSKRWLISFCAWFKALSTSFHCTFETMSKLGVMASARLRAKDWRPSVARSFWAFKAPPSPTSQPPHLDHTAAKAADVPSPSSGRSKRRARAMGRLVADLSEVLRELYARVPWGVRLGLGPLTEACAKLDHPERAFEVVHVAGTNGKGSVSAMVESTARIKGVKTGLYTSPHLARFAERIRLGGAPIDDAALTELLADSLRREPTLTFFEIATLAAFRAFRAAKVELAVLEVGLGGRLDATNVVPKPRAAAITRIALDHTDRLGTTLESIAREKAGIAKPGLEIVLGAMSREVRADIDEVAHAAGATTLPVDEDAGANGFTDAAK